MSGFELDRTAATNRREYLAEALRMKDMVVSVWDELFSKEGGFVTSH